MKYLPYVGAIALALLVNLYESCGFPGKLGLMVCIQAVYIVALHARSPNAHRADSGAGDSGEGHE